MLRRYLKSAHRLRLCAAVVALLVALAAPGAEAAVAPWSLTEVTLRAGLIVRGRVTGQLSAWDKEEAVIFTLTTVEVLDQIKWQTNEDRLAIRTPGGVVGDIGLWVEPAPHFVPGEEVLVFLEPSPAGGYQVVGSVQGKYTIRQGWAINEDRDAAVPLISLIRRILGIMQAHGVDTALPADWASRFPPATTVSPGFFQPLGFVYEGYHWPGPDPMGEDYLVNVNTTDVPAAQALQAIQAAADTWTNVSGADFEFTYGGPSTATDKSSNDKNEIMWKDEGDTGTLATTWYWYWTSSKEIFEADMVINDYYRWDTSDLPANNEFDLQSVALHEFGHYLHLGHDSNPGAMMYYSISAGSLKRTLHQNDIDGIRFIYPGTTCLSDFNGDGTVTLDEVTAVASRWRLNPVGSYDLNGDLVIDIIDIVIAARELGLPCD